MCLRSGFCRTGFAESLWAHAFLLFEEFIQMAFVGEAQFGNDLIDTLVAVFEAMLDQRGLVLVYIRLHGFPAMLFEIAAQVIFGNAEMPADVFRADLFVFVDIALNVIEDVDYFFFG